MTMLISWNNRQKNKQKKGRLPHSHSSDIRGRFFAIRVLGYDKPPYTPLPLPPLFKKNYFLYWRIIALQNFVVFCQISTWISHRCTSVPSLLNQPPISLPIPPLTVDTEPLFEFPEPYSKFPLAIYFAYSNVSFYVILSMQLTLSSLLPMSIGLFIMSVSPLLP